MGISRRSRLLEFVPMCGSSLSCPATKQEFGNPRYDRMVYRQTHVLHGPVLLSRCHLLEYFIVQA